MQVSDIGKLEKMRKAVLSCLTLFYVDLFLCGSGCDLTEIFLKLR